MHRPPHKISSTSHSAERPPSSAPPTGGDTARSPRLTSRSGPRLLLLLVLLLLLGSAPFLYRRIDDTTQASAQLEQGALAFAQGRPNEAERSWLSARRLTPNNPNVYRALIGLYLAQGRLPDAHTAANRLADIAPDEPHTLCELADVELHGGGGEVSEPAGNDAQRAARLEPGCVRAQTVAGDACLLKGDYKQGLNYLRKATQIKPEDVPLTLHLISKMLEIGDMQNAKKVAAGLIQRYPGYAQGYVLMAAVCNLYPRSSPESRSMEDLLRTALRLEPTNALAHANLGVLLLNTGDSKRALPHLEAAQYLGYNDSPLIYNLYQVYKAQRRTVEAKRALNDFLTISRLENERDVMEKQRATSPDDEMLRQRLASVASRLEQAQQVYRARWALTDTLKSPAPSSGVNGAKHETAPAVTSPRGLDRGTEAGLSGTGKIP